MNLVILILPFLVFQASQNGLETGWYRANTKNGNHELLISADRTFIFRKGRWDYTFGNWKIADKKLILNSKSLTQTDSLTIALSSGKYFSIKNKEFKVSKGKLIDSEGRRFIH
ncbi:hypothetical protein [Pontibacter oryzae]|uniref:Uncharacterized protein n=1 Tax=Pontibacter oryzae TaxID=2304593 RepID=A0A399SMK4_9BACT|nr:hypothetical protein [Pontibacter oryzae]RIJ43035.1 hypothetical protein D1627_04155 [Pontibacter oryzae]